ncbi:MAG TPA: hypothetical protein VII52_03085 [Gemmatimonadaceae bacterium]
MLRPIRSALGIGSASGLLFFLNALLRGSYLFPLVWPLLGGGLVVYIANRSAERLLGWRRPVVLAAGAGLVAALVFIVLGTGCLYVSAGGSLLRAVQTLGRSVVWSVDGWEVENTVILALATIPLTAMIGGALAFRFPVSSRFRSSTIAPSSPC